MTGQVFADCAGLGAFDMQRMYQYETGSHPGVQERFGPTDDVNIEKTFPQVANVRSVDPELLYNEDKLGCARGIIWAVVLQAALIAAIAMFWRLRFIWR
jgi:hypothetical protein